MKTGMRARIWSLRIIAMPGEARHDEIVFRETASMSVFVLYCTITIDTLRSVLRLEYACFDCEMSCKIVLYQYYDYDNLSMA